ncbi:DUF2269 family protein [Sphingobium sp. CECT 9361]|uniref:DUF2269 family protein n=1 Tax=Sphingobium sp. CECT 9361 TaxID=2845384 RepID=UPI001E2869D0|nr:DUF2269 family protein [Sphingobium sp. CECT 9361]CAH0349213.1 hypothetical protein SPH9361_00492 [Sphingobium sp. CECT 9361]
MAVFWKMPLVTGCLLLLAYLLSRLIVTYEILKFLHVLAFIGLGSGLIGIFLMELQARKATSFQAMADTIAGLLAFYYRLTVPSSMLTLVSGFSLIFGFYGWGFLEMPWLAGMMVLFLFEFLEGHIIMKLHYVRIRDAVAEARKTNEATKALDDELAAGVTNVTHFLDVPNFMLIVALGVLRPASWTFFYAGIAVVIAVTAFATYYIPSRFPWKGRYANDLPGDTAILKPV